MNLNPEPLFNKTVIEKLCSKIKLTDLQKQSALTWIKKIENNELRDEQKRQNLFEKYILMQILGYDLEELPREDLEIDYTMEIPGFQKSMCMEVKGTKTKDLFKDQKRKDDSKYNPVIQLYTYMSHGFDYGVVSNYKDFILLTKNTQLVKAHKFNFLSIKKTEDRIDENKLKEFILLFSKKEVFVNNSIEELTNQTVLSEQEFTDEFYKLFHETRLMLIKEFEESSNVPHDVAIYYSQIFLNRLIFIYFVEDHNFIPSSLFEKRIIGILQSPSIDESTHLIFDDVMGLFKIMNTGSKVHGVNGFNGGLFGDDVIPSNIIFSDLRDTDFFTECYKNSNLKIKATTVDIAISGIYAEKLSPLIKNLLIMASHDFTSDLDVNILGRIFEQSISDIELLKENEISKRKKFGVYYTPNYVTDYICRNTIIPYLSKTNKTSVFELVEEYSENIEELETKLKNLKILDPACGSGAFLVKSVDILLEIDEEIQLRKPKKISSQSGMDEFTKIQDINLFIENNIYGVDINPASVEITKLSLFLKLAGPESKLGYLSNNIKTGNSLIQDKKIAKNAFSWEDEFPEILGSLISNKGFDIILGNPPYVRVESLETKYADYYKNNYYSVHERCDLYVPFIQKFYELLKQDGKCGMIVSNQFMIAQYGLKIREMITAKWGIEKLIDYTNFSPFREISTYSVILIGSKIKNNIISCSRIKSLDAVKQLNQNGLENIKNIEDIQIFEYGFETLNSEPWIIRPKIELGILKKISDKKFQKLGNYCNISSPLKTGKDSILCGQFISKQNNSITLSFENDGEFTLEQEIWKPLIRPVDIKKWNVDDPLEFVFFPYVENDSKFELISENDFQTKYSQTYNYLLKYKKILLERKDSRLTWAQKKLPWYSLHRLGKPLNHQKNKIVTNSIINSSKFSFDNIGYFVPTGGVLGVTISEIDPYFLLGYLNSKIILYFLKSIASLKRGGYISLDVGTLSKVPIPKIEIKQEKIISKQVEQILILKKDHTEIMRKFSGRILQNLKPKKLTKKLITFHELDFEEFFGELKKQKIRLTLQQQEEWEEYFMDKKDLMLKNLEKINQLESDINSIIYKLYGLNEDEIKIMENDL
ncbi:N-6 DNA methylase [Nitrosopumilus sp.]|nr:N-6 DNA methylase [Nitrosopumilus sp.]MDB4839895.1 N-6 DNA methylase [Nitrosopumilus sp.]